jgi:hypothetical protein
MPDNELSEFVLSVIDALRERGIDAVQTWMRSVQAGSGGDLILRVPCGKRIMPEAGFRTEGFPA